MRTIAISTVLAVTGLGILSGCGESEAAGTTTPAPQKQTLGTIGNLSVTDGFYLAGQPQEGDIALLKEQGIKTVIDLRQPSEDRGFDEAAVVEAAGISYVPVPFSASDLDDNKLNQLSDLLKNAENQPVFLHCGSANRVGAVWYAHRVLNDGLDEEAALTEAKEVGLRNAQMEQTVVEYVTRKKGG